MPSDGCQLAGLVRKRFVGQWIGIAESSVLGRGVGVKSLVTLEITAWAGVCIRGERNGLKDYVQVLDLCPWAIRVQRKVCSRKTEDSLMSLKGYSQAGVEIAQETTVEENRFRQQLGQSGD